MKGVYHLVAGILIGLVNDTWQARLIASLFWGGLALALPRLRFPGYPAVTAAAGYTVFAFAVATLISLVR